MFINRFSRILRAFISAVLKRDTISIVIYNGYLVIKAHSMPSAGRRERSKASPGTCQILTKKKKS